MAELQDEKQEEDERKELIFFKAPGISEISKVLASEKNLHIFFYGRRPIKGN